MTIAIRKLAPGDRALPGLLRLTLAAFADLPASPAQALTLDKLEAKLREGAGYVAEAKGVPVGGLFTRPSRDVPGALYIGTLAVDPACRGQGLAGRLVACAEAQARQDERTAMTLDTYAPASHLIALFARMGFVLNARSEDVVTMVRLLDPPVRRLPADRSETAAVLALLRDGFACMDGVIDPPSSLHRLTEDGVARQAEEGEVWVVGTPPVACVFLTPNPGALSLGKLVCAAPYRGLGLARRLVALAEDRARAQGLPVLDLQARVELTSNHAVFAALGFQEMGRSTHPGFDRPTSIIFRKRVPPASATE